MTIPKAILIGAAMIAVATFAFSFFGDRYHIVQGPVASAWKIDKITGAVWLCNAGKCTPFSN